MNPGTISRTIYIVSLFCMALAVAIVCVPLGVYVRSIPEVVTP